MTKAFRSYPSGAQPYKDHATVSAIAPLVCFVTTLAMLVLFRLVSIYAAVAVSCAGTDEFWYSAYERNWPLVAAFILVFFLLFVWSIVMAFDDWRSSTGSKVMIVANILAILLCFVPFQSMHDNASIAFYEREGYYEAITSNRGLPVSWRSENVCKTYQRFSGRWRVVESDLGHYGFDIPASWIELYPWGAFQASVSGWEQPIHGRWKAPFRDTDMGDGRWRDGYIDADDFGGPWDFHLQGSTLILTSPPEYFRPWQRSRVELARVGTE